MFKLLVTCTHILASGSVSHSIVVEIEDREDADYAFDSISMKLGYEVFKLYRPLEDEGDSLD